MMHILWTYVRELYCFAKWTLILDLLLTILLGLSEGAGLILLLPLLTFAGISPGVPEEVTAWGKMLAQLLHVKLTLPVVLAVYTMIIAGQSWLRRYELVLNAKIQEAFYSLLSNTIYRSLTYARWSFFLLVKKSEVAHVLTSELMRVSMGTYYFLQLLATGVLAAAQIVIAFCVAPYLTLLVMCAGLIAFCCLHFLLGEARRMGTDISNFTGDLFSEITEHLNGIKEVKSYGIEALQVENFARHRQKVEQSFIDFTNMQSRTDMLYKIGAAVFISIFYYMAIEIFHLNTQEFLIIVVIFARLWPTFSSFQEGLQYVVMMLPAFQAVIGLRTRCLAETEQPELPQIQGRIYLRTGLRLRDVFFRYDLHNKHYALRAVNCLIPAGTTTAVVGVSGAGKSTLADLIIGLIRPEQGEILLDNKRLDGGNMYAWRQSIGYVPQDAFLFNARIRDNLLWACPHATEDDIWEALKMAAIDDFVRNLPEELDTVVGDRGIRLSGGERQRIVLARALLRKPELLILDEATSALDGENEKRIQQAIEGLQGKLTILIIAHRMSTVSHADRIIVLEQGRIVEQGSYRTCASDKNSRFYKLACL